MWRPACPDRLQSSRCIKCDFVVAWFGASFKRKSRDGFSATRKAAYDAARTHEGEMADLSDLEADAEMHWRDYAASVARRDADPSFANCAECARRWDGFLASFRAFDTAANFDTTNVVQLRTAR